MISTRAFRLLWVSLCISPIQSWAAPITFNTALPVAKNAFINREQLIIKRFKQDSSSLDRELKVEGLVSVIGYGVTPKLAAFAALPYLEKLLRLNLNGFPQRRSSENFSDLKLFARYTLFQQDERSKTFRMAAFVGADSSSGKSNQQDEFGPLPQSLQSGSGSTDPFAGFVATYQTLDYEIDAQISYQNNASNNNFEFGDILKADTSFQYRIFPNKMADETNSFTYAVIELNLIKQQQNQFFRTKNINSGGTTIFLTPGIQYVTAKYILEAAVQLPVVQNLNGNALEIDYIFTTGFRVNF